MVHVAQTCTIHLTFYSIIVVQVWYMFSQYVPCLNRRCTKRLRPVMVQGYMFLRNCVIVSTSLLSIRHCSREMVRRCMWYSHGLICKRRPSEQASKDSLSTSQPLPFVVFIILVAIGPMNNHSHHVRDVKQKAVAYQLAVPLRYVLIVQRGKIVGM